MTDDTETPDPAQEVLAEVRRLKAAPTPDPEPDTWDQPDWAAVDGFADLDSFFDDHLVLPIRGKQYRIPPADAELGLLCSRLVAAGEKASRNQRISSTTVAQLNDAEEQELYERLLGHTLYVPGTGAEAVLCDGGEVLPDGTQCKGGEELKPEVPPTPNPHYRAEDDVWDQLFADGLDWQRIQHVGTTAMIWTAVGKEAAQAFWMSGARPKASVAPPRVPEDHKPKAAGAKSGRPGSTAGTKSRAKSGKGAATAGT